MVRRKTTASSVAAVTIYRDEPDQPLDSDSENASHHLPPRKKIRRSKETQVAATAPRTRRAALKEKATNPSSSDNSFLRQPEHELFYEKLQKVKPKPELGSQAVKEPDCGSKNVSPLQEASAVGNTVYQTLGKQQLPVEDLGEILSLMRRDAAQEAADLITKKGFWFPDLLNSFRASNLASLDLSSPSSPSGVLIPLVPPSLTLKVLFQQDRFSTLTVVSFRNTPLLNDDMAFLRLLPSLEDIDISNTGVGTQSLHHFVCHRHTLKVLNIANNSLIDDDSRVALSAFPRLSALYLRGTSITMPGLRRLVLKDLHQSCRLLSVPASCIDHLNSRHVRYVVDIPAGYVQDPTHVPTMMMPNLKRNLELHAKANKDVQVTGTKVELVNRLSTILSNRLADTRILAVLGRA